MFTIEHELYLGDLGHRRTASVTGYVTDAFGDLTPRVTSVNVQFDAKRSLECWDLLDKGSRYEIEVALLAHYAKLKERWETAPEDWVRDEVAT